PADGIGIGCCPAGIDLHISADGPAKRLQPLQEGSEPCLVMRIVRRCGEEHADAPHPLALLRARRERPRRCCAVQRDELAAFDHGGLLPRVAWAARNTRPPADGPTQSVCRTISLPQRGRLVLGGDPYLF